MRNTFIYEHYKKNINNNLYRIEYHITKFDNTRRKNTTYCLYKNGKMLIVTSLHQTFYSWIKKFEKGIEI